MDKQFVRTCLVSLAAILGSTVVLELHRVVRADDQQEGATKFVEVAPYKFADLPHGRVYKAVHQGCELFIVEGSMRVTGAPDSGFFYSIATGRGCK